jgi:hypothetical protein
MIRGSSNQISHPAWLVGIEEGRRKHQHATSNSSRTDCFVEQSRRLSVPSTGSLHVFFVELNHCHLVSCLLISAFALL